MTTHPKLDVVPNKDQYKTLYNKSAKLGRYTVLVTRFSRDGRQGSYERGFKFTTIVYGILRRNNPDAKAGYQQRFLYSANHGQSWHENTKDACRAKGKIILSRDKYNEMAFEDIQSINRRWEGPSYVWKP